MIVQMSKVFIATRVADRDRLLAFLSKINLMHLEPVKPEKAVADENITRAFNDICLAMQILSAIKPSGSPLSQAPVDAAREAIELRKAIIENQRRLLELHQRINKLEVWGNVRIRQLEDLRKSGVEIRFFMIPQHQAHRIRAECAEIVSILPGKKFLLAVIDRSGQFTMPEGAQPLPFPSQDRASVLAQAKKIDNQVKQSHDRLARLATLTGVMKKEQTRLARQMVYVKAQRSGMNRDEIFALQGWLPTEKADKIESQLAEDNLHVAVHMKPLQMDDVPPTLIRYPFWAKPIQGLFDMLGTLPGYREIDLSPFFMLALPVFAAMLIGDAGYGLLIFLSGLFFYHKIVRVAGKPAAQIMIIFGLVTLGWGILIANYFGVTPEILAKGSGFVILTEKGPMVDYDTLRKADGFYGQIAGMMQRAGIFWQEDPNDTRFLIMKVSLIIGCFHLILAHLRKIVELIPDQRALAEIGWIIITANMLVLIWYLLFIGVEQIPIAIWWIFGAAFVLSSFFGKPDSHLAKRILMGLFSSMFPLLNAFTDTMSYIRLFAVGLSSYYIASSFNEIAVKLADAATWYAAAPILIFGHGLNIGLAIIAIFAHGVRLNMLEFSNHAGVQWNGYAYQPFTTKQDTILGEKS